MTTIRHTFAWQNAFNWVRRAARQHAGVVFTAELPDRWLDCWQDRARQQHIRTRYKLSP